MVKERHEQVQGFNTTTTAVAAQHRTYDQRSCTEADVLRVCGIPESWLVSAAKRGELKRVQFGHHKVFPREELLRFAEEYKKKSGV